jgi:hypothetical protein
VLDCDQVRREAERDELKITRAAGDSDEVVIAQGRVVIRDLIRKGLPVFRPEAYV